MESLIDKRKLFIEIAQKQLFEALTTFRIQYTLLTQFLSVIAIGNITVFGWGLNSKNSGLLMLGCVFPITALILRKIFIKNAVPVMVVAINLEDVLVGEYNIDWLSKTYLINREPKLVELALKIRNFESQTERQKMILDYSSSYKRIFYGLINRVLIICFFLQLIFAMILKNYYCWTMF